MHNKARIKTINRVKVEAGETTSGRIRVFKLIPRFMAHLIIRQLRLVSITLLCVFFRRRCFVVQIWFPSALMRFSTMLLPQSLDITWFELERLEDKRNYCYIDLFDCFDASGLFFFKTLLYPPCAN